MLDEQSEQPALHLRLDAKSGVPTYLQLVQQVEHAIRLGRLRAGDKLPTVKDAVASLAINPNTVLKAYRELEHKGLVAGRPGVGTFVIGTPEVVPLRDLNTLRRSLNRWIDQANAAGLDDDALRAMIADAFAERARAATPAPQARARRATS